MFCPDPVTLQNAHVSLVGGSSPRENYYALSAPLRVKSHPTSLERLLAGGPTYAVRQNVGKKVFIEVDWSGV